MTNGKQSSEAASLRPLILVLLVVIILWSIAAVSVYSLLPDWPTRGQFGDMFGVANTLFSGMAFAGIIYTILLQRQELKLQRRELELTRDQLTRTATAQASKQPAPALSSRRLAR